MYKEDYDELLGMGIQSQDLPKSGTAIFLNVLPDTPRDLIREDPANIIGFINTDGFEVKIGDFFENPYDENSYFEVTQVSRVMDRAYIYRHVINQ